MLIGAFRSQEGAEAAIAKLRTQPGFNQHPGGFGIDEYPLDEVNWQEGFV